jgi:SLT domain-containing protein
MQLEELEVVFKANYGDLVSKTQQIYQLIESKTNSLANNIQNDLNRANQATQSGVQSSNQAAEATVRAEEKKQQAYQKTSEAKKREAVEIQTWTDNETKAMTQASEAADKFQEATKKVTSSGDFDPTVLREAYKQYKAASDRIWQDTPAPKIVKQADPGIDDLIKSQSASSRQDVSDLYDTVNERMAQAKREQAKLVQLMNSRPRVQASGDPLQLQRIDAQIDQSRIKMARYQNQAKALAQAMRTEFGDIPNTLKRIANAMDENEIAIEAQRRKVSELKRAYIEAENAGRDSSDIKAEYNKQDSILDKLIAHQDDLEKSYEYTQDRGEALKNTIDKLNTSLEETDVLSKRASSSGSGGGFFSNLKQRLSGISSVLSGTRSRLNLFGMSALSAGRKASSGFRSSSSSASGLSRTIRMLASQIIVFQLISQAIMNMAGAFVSALKTNSQFASSLNQIKVNLLTAFYPIYQTALPAINALMSALAKATGYIASFVSALTGTSLSANRAGAKGLYEQVQALNDTSKASNSANDALKKQQQEQANAVRAANKKIQEANKEGRAAVEKENEKIAESNAKAKKAWEAQKKASEDMKNSLMGFDEINILDKDSSKDDSTFTPQEKKKFTPQDTQEVPTFSSLDSGSGAGSGAGNNDLNWNVPINENGGAFKAAKDFKKLMGELFDPLKEAWASKGQSVIEAAKRAWAELSRAVGDVGRSFKTVWTNGTGQKVVEDLLKLFRTLLNIIGDVGRAFAQAWEDHNRGTNTVQAIFNALHKVLVLLNDIGASFRKAFNSGVGESIFAHLINYAQNLAKQVGALAGQFDKAWKAGGTGEDIWKTLLGMVDDYAAYIDKASASWAKFDSHLNFGPILKSFDNLLKSVRLLGQDAFSGLYWALTNVLQPLTKWATEDLAPAAMDALAAALKLIHTVINAAKPAFLWVWDSFLKPIAKWTGDLVISGLKLLTEALTGLSDWASKHQTLITNVAKVLMTWFAFKVSTSAIETATSKFGSLLGVVKDVWEKKGVFKTLLSAFTNFSGLGKVKEIVENVKLIGSYAKDVAQIGWTKLTSHLSDFGSKLKSIWTTVSDLAGASWSKITTGLSDLGGTIKDLAKLTWSKVISGVKAIGDFVSTLAKTTWSKLVDGFSSLYDVVVDLAKVAWTKFMTGMEAVSSFLATLAKTAWTKIVSGLSTLGEGLQALWVVLSANPVVAVVAAFAALVAIFTVLYKTNKPFRNWCNDVWGSISDTFGGLGKWFSEKWNDITSGWEDFKTSFGKTWSEGWNGIKEGVTGKKGVWTKIKSGASDMWGNISGSWGTFKTDFKTSWDSHWGSIKSKVGGKNSGIFHDVISGAGSMFGGIKSHMSSWWPDFSNNWGSHWGSVKSKVGGKNSGIFHDVISGAGSMFSGIKSHMTSWWPGFSKTWGKHWGSAKGTVTDAFDTLVTKAGKLGGRISNAVKGGWKAITKTFGSLANKIISPIQSVIKKIGQGINWALHKVGQKGFDWTFDWTFKYANGTGGHPGGLALVNDQEGPTYQEAYQLPNGQTGLFPAVRNLLLDMPTGTKVMPAGQVKQIMDSAPHYAGGIGSFDWGDWLKDLESTMSRIGGSITTTISNTASAIGDAFDDVLSDITHPSKLINFLINKFVGSNNQDSSIGKRFFAGGVNTMKNNMVNWAKNFLKKFGIDAASNPSGSGVMRWRPYVIKALRANGIEATGYRVNKILATIQRESGGNPRAINLWDSNAKAGIPSKGLMQTIGPTFNAYKFPGHGNIYNGYDDLLAAINYIKHRYGTTDAAFARVAASGYANGGLIDREGYYLAGEGDKPEMVLPLTNRSRSLELIQQAMQFMGTNFSNGLRMPSAFTQPSFNTQAPQVASQGVNSDLGATIVNALMQGLQMSQISSGKQGSQPINVTIQVDSTKLGEVAVKGINQYNQANGRNMLRI